MQIDRHRRAIGIGTLAGLGAAGVLAHVRLKRLIAGDPQRAVLSEPPEGETVTVRSADGTELRAQRFGASDGQPVVLAHGWTEMLDYWAYEIRELSSRGFQVIAYDLRGHGHSQPASGGDYALARFGEDLEAVLETCLPDDQRAVVVGHSLGAMSLAAWAEHHDVQRRVCAAAMLNTGVGELLAEQLLVPVPALAQLVNRLIPPTVFLGSSAPLPRFSTPLSYALIRYVAFGRAASPAQIAFFERMLVACPPDVRADVGMAMSEMDLYGALANLTVPVLVVAGADDKLTPPSHAKRIAESVPNLHRLVVLEDTGHMGPLERPREITEAVVELAQATSPARAGSAA